jgi:hypothetical protein
MYMSNMDTYPYWSVVEVVDKGHIIVHTHFYHGLVCRKGSMKHVIYTGYSAVFTEESMVLNLGAQEDHVRRDKVKRVDPWSNVPLGAFGFKYPVEVATEEDLSISLRSLDHPALHHMLSIGARGHALRGLG